jgi:hypothetical protein
MEEDINQIDYHGGYNGGLATYQTTEINTQTDSTTILSYENLQIIIPSYDEYMSRILSFMDKSAKLVTFKYKTLDNTNIKPETPVKVSLNTNVNIQTFNNDIVLYNSYNQLNDINVRFYIERKYEVYLDKKNIDELLDTKIFQIWSE